MPSMRRERRIASTTGVLALLALAIGCYVFFGEILEGASRRKAQEAALRVAPLPPNAVSSVVLARPGGRIRCVREAGRWMIVEPVHTQGDEVAITKLVKDLTTARIHRKVNLDAGGFKQAGLEHPVRITLGTPARELTVFLGSTSPTGDYTYVGMGPEGRRVVLADRKLSDDAKLSLYDLRDKDAVSFDPAQVTSLRLRAGGRLVRLIRSGAAGSEWRVAQGTDGRGVVADRGLVERTLDLVSDVRAERFASEDQADLRRYGLRPAVAEVTFEFGNRRDTIAIGKATVFGALTRYYACRPGKGPVFEINDNLLRMAKRSLAEWRDKHVADFDKSAVTEVRLLTPAHTLVLVKDTASSEETWHLAQYIGKVDENMGLAAAAKMPTAQRADADRVEEILSRLSALQVTAFVPGRAKTDPSLGLDHPSLKVTAMDASGRLLASVSFGKQKGPYLYAASTHLDQVFLVKALDTDRFRAGVNDVAAR
ncbi:MAG: DUF4340 domain-containing protein [Chthonomonadales bacterium]